MDDRGRGDEERRGATPAQTVPERPTPREILDALPFPVSSWSAVRDASGSIVDFVCTEANREAERRVRFEVGGCDTVVGLLYRDTLSRHDLEPTWPHFVGVVEHRRPASADVYVPEAPKQWFEHLTAPLGDGFVDSMRDISGRRRALDDLAAGEERFRTTMEAIADAVFVLDAVRDGGPERDSGVAEDRLGPVVGFELAYSNAAACTLVGRPAEQLIGRSHVEVLPASFSAGVDRHRSAYEQGAVVRFDAGHDDALPGAFEVTISPISRGLVVVAHDVTDRVAAQELAKESERRFRLMADHAGDVVVSVKDGLIEWAAPSMVRLLGWPADEVVGTDSMLYVHPDELDVVSEARFTVSASTRHRMRLRRKDGEWQWVDVLARVAGPDDDADHPLVVTIIDAHAEVEARAALQRAEDERQRLDERVREADRLESLSQLAGGIAHDFNNLLVGILGNAELALQDLSPGSPVRSRLVALSSAAQRAADLTRQLLDFTGKQPRERVALDLAPLIADTIDLARSMTPRDLPIVFVPDSSGTGVLGDRTQLQQVVMNLVMNACEAVDPHTGRVEVSLRRVTLGHDVPELGLHPGDHVVVEVSDNGRGIEPDHQRRIFDPFFTTRADGRGLGLAVVSGIVRAHHGAVDVRSQPGVGTTFSVWMPAAELPSTSPSSNPSFRLHRQPTVMVVDDDDQVRDVVGDILRRAGFRVLAVGRGRDAISLFASRHANIDIVVLDLTMPDLTGDEVMVVLRAVEPNIPIVLISGYLGSDAVRDAATMKATDMVQKPFLPDDLVDAVRRSLRQTPFQGHDHDFRTPVDEAPGTSTD